MKFLVKIFSFIIILLTSSRVVAQTPDPELDSLNAAVAMAPDSLKAKIFNEKAWEKRHLEPARSLEYAKIAAELAIKTKNDRELALAYNYIGIGSKKLGLMAEAIDSYNKSIDVSSRIGMKDEEGYGYNNLGVLCNVQGLFPEAEEYLRKAEAIGLEINDKMLLAYIYLALGETYIGLRDTDKALKTLYDALKLRIEINSPIVSINAVIKTIGNVHYSIRDYSSAKNCYYTVISQSKDAEDLEQLSDIMQNLANIYYYERKYDSSLHFSKQALDYSLRLGNMLSIRNAYNAIGNAYYSMHDDYSASQNYMLGIAYNDSVINASVTQKVFDVQAVMAKYEKEAEISKINESNKIQIFLLTIALVALALGGITFLWLRNQRRRMVKLNNSLRYQHKQITDSISYSQKIQDSILPEPDSIGNSFAEKFVLYKPCKVVGGDFYWHYDCSSYEMVAVADCIDRGVPGAFMSLLANTALQEIASAREYRASEILKKLKTTLESMLKRGSSDSGIDSRLNIALIVVDKQTSVLDFAGENLPLVYVKDGQMNVLAHSRCVRLSSGDRVYMSSDGFCLDKERKSKVMQSDYKNLVSEISVLPMPEQKSRLEQFYTPNYSDDICVLGFKF